MNVFYSRDGENPTHQHQFAKKSDGNERTMDTDLMQLFSDFKLDENSSNIADCLGVRVVSDFNDVEERHVLSVCNTLSLKPVYETRLRRLVQWVQSSDNSHVSSSEKFKSPLLSSRESQSKSLYDTQPGASPVWNRNEQGQVCCSFCEIMFLGSLITTSPSGASALSSVHIRSRA